ncbi:MAG TPA: hypothetical protein DCM08_09370, partial [Microscillaceae bacterium]|nr:hypothetical protein [Microscillaceae bacterium]
MITKKNYWFVVCWMVGSFWASTALAEGIKFTDGTWQQTVEAAKSAKKLILIWAYKPGCGACKQMADEVFPSDEVGAYFNNNFINFQLNTKKEEGIALFAKFEGVLNPATPTFYFIDPATETLLLKQIGSTDVEGFLDFGKTALNFPTLMSQYKAGKMSQEEKIDFWMKLQGCNKAVNKDVQAYFSSLSDKDLVQYEIFKLMTYYALEPDSREFKYYITHTEAFKSELGINLDWYYGIVYEEVYQKGVANKDKA